MKLPLRSRRFSLAIRRLFAVLLGLGFGPGFDPALAADALAAAPAPGGASGSRHVRCVVGISPFLPDDAKNETFRHLVHLLLEGLPRNSSLWILDAYHLRSIARLNIPDVRAFDSGKTRATQFRAPIEEVRRFLATPHPTPEATGFESALQVPQFLDFVAENAVSPDQATRVLLLGSPLHLDPKEPAFSMAHGYFPSDGHLLASRERTVYGLADRGQRLAGVSVALGWFGDPWISDLHRQKVVRFWRLFVGRQGGVLAGFGGDLPTLFLGLVPRPGAPPMAGPTEDILIDPTNTKVEMLRLTREVASFDWITSDRPAASTPPPPTHTIGPLKIGIRWPGRLDLDLYARAQPRSERLDFQHPRADEGYYYKDHRSSPDREFEFIEFVAPVDVRAVEAAVNLYQGSCPGGVEGEVRLEFEGRIYSDRFRLEADSGNQGREGPAQTRWWTRLDLPRILRLP